MANLHREISAAGHCVLTFDRPDSTANIFDEATFAELNAQLDFLVSPEAGAIKGVIFRSAKPKIFLAGADLIGFTKDPSPEKIESLIRVGQQTFRRIASLQVPSVAAIHGLALGGGCEITLACDYRVASTAGDTKIGLPEVQIGILPGWGGSTILPRLIGLPKSLEVILSGKQLAAIPALKAGLVDAVGPSESLLALAEKQIAKGKRGPLPRHFANLAPAAALIARQARANVLSKTGGHYPAPLKALEVVIAALRGSIDEGLALEKKAFIELATGDIARNLIGIFLLQERSKKTPLPADLSLPTTPPRKIGRVTVVGAGVMGAGIAQWLAARGTSVLLKDIAPEPLAAGLQSIQKLFRDAVKRRRFSAVEARAALDRIVPVAGDVPLKRSDLVIEAAVERLDLKQRIFRDLETATAPGVVLATNTSALSIDSIAGALQDPGRVVGIHFFNPVHRMQLVEIVRGDRTSALALDTALRFVKGIGKLPVLVRDRPGFLVNRILTPYLTEAGRLCQEGYGVADIDHAMERFGMPMGPLRLIDEVGLDVGRHVAADLAARLTTPQGPPVPAMDEMIARKWLGKKSGRGFYVHAGKGKPTLNVDLESLPGIAPRQPPDPRLFHDRLILPMINEAARVLEEHVVDAPEDVDFGMIMGSGWAPFRGGPLRYADSLGARKVVDDLNALASRLGDRFQPCDRLTTMAADNREFYS
jgi:3-hydroxyacyl-CoA dehydrogenase / enoyl-CoA hydratase / 3-hydroxybutyryl-CoA epimerase